jgi:hypothetical protein
MILNIIIKAFILLAINENLFGDLIAISSGKLELIYLNRTLKLMMHMSSIVISSNFWLEVHSQSQTNKLD